MTESPKISSNCQAEDFINELTIIKYRRISTPIESIGRKSDFQEKSIKIVDSEEAATPPAENCGSLMPYQLQIQSTNEDYVSIHDLPSEVLEYIFSFLEIEKRIEIESVCKYWRWIGKNRPWSWPRELTISEECGDSTSNVLCSEIITDDILFSLVSRCGRCLRYLTLWQSKYSFWDSEKTVQIIGECCPNLLEITLNGIPVSYQARIETLGVGCPKLKSMKLHQYWDIGDEDIIELLRGCDKLECLQVSAGPTGNAVTGECFRIISNKNFKVLRLYRCRCLTDSGLEMLTSRCDALQDLRLTQCVKINQDILVKVLRHYKHTLKVLFLEEYCEAFNWCDALRVLRHLEKLSICECYHVNDDVCRCLANNCLKLKVLNISSTGITDVGLTYLQSLTNLVQLDVTCLSLQGYGLEALAAQRRLEVVYAKFVTDLTSADHTFGLLGSCCSHLNTLDVSGIEEITPDLVESFCQLIRMGRLKPPVQLGLEFTLVTADVETCDGLELVFENVSSLYDEDYDFDEDDGAYENSYDTDEEDYDFYDDY